MVVTVSEDINQTATIFNASYREVKIKGAFKIKKREDKYFSQISCGIQRVS